MKKVVCIILILAVSMSMFNVVSASGNNEGGILSAEVDDATILFAQSVYKQLVHALHSSTETMGDIEDYLLGHPITVWNVKNEKNIIYFPVIRFEKIEGLLEIFGDANEMSASYAVDFSEELAKLLSNATKKTYSLLNDGEKILAYDGKEYVEIYRMHTALNNDGVFAKTIKNGDEVRKTKQIIVTKDMLHSEIPSQKNLRGTHA